MKAAAGKVWDTAHGARGKAEHGVGDVAGQIPVDLSVLEGRSVGESGDILSNEGLPIGKIVEGNPEDLVGQIVGANGEILDEDGDLIGTVELIPDNAAAAAAAKKAQDAMKMGEQALSFKDLTNLPVTKEGNIKDQNGRVLGHVVEGDPSDLIGQTVNEKGEILGEDGNVIGRVGLAAPSEVGGGVGAEDAKGVADKAGVGEMMLDISILSGKRINKRGKIMDEEGDIIGQVAGDYDPKGFTGKFPNQNGQVLDDKGNVIGQVEIVPGEAADEAISALREKVGGVGQALPDTAVVEGLVPGKAEEAIPEEEVPGEEIPEEAAEKLPEGEVPEEEVPEGPDMEEEVPKEPRLEPKEAGLGDEISQEQLQEEAIPDEGAPGEIEGAAEAAADKIPPVSTLEGLTCNKMGKIVNKDGIPVGELIEGDAKKLSQAGFQLDDQGQFWDNKGNVIGKVQPTVPEEQEIEGPFAEYEDLFVLPDGWVQDKNGQRVGQIVEGDAKKLVGRAVDDDGDILDRKGNVIGHAEPWEEPESEVEEVDFSLLAGLKVNKLGNIVGPDGVPLARVTEGDLKAVIGRSIDAEGQIWNDKGEVIGRVELIPEDERETLGPFSGLGELKVNKDGLVEDSNGHIVGRLVEGDAQKLQGQMVDESGEILDKYGAVKGRAEPYEPEEEVIEEEDLSALDGKTVNKMGNVVDEHGTLFGRIVSGNPKKMAGRKVDGFGRIWSDDGQVIGQAELIPADERERPEGPFFGLEGLVLAKDGMVVDPNGQVVGRLIEGDEKRLVGRLVDEDGEITDKLGNVIGRAEPYTPEEKQRDINPMAGYKVNRDGEVRDADGNMIGKLTSGDLQTAIGKTIDDNGYVVDNDGNKIGECTLLENIPEEPEPELSPEELEKLEKEKQTRELAAKMCSIVQQALDSIEPLCKQITEHLDAADRKPKEELDEEQLVQVVKPLIEEAGQMLQECKGALRALDPDGQVAALAKARSASQEATPEEYRLAELLKELTQNIVTTIENGRKRLAGMPHAKKKINPLWALLSEPLFQIIAAVGLLLSGVLGIVSRLLDGLGLGGLVRGLLGNLGLDKLLEGLGLGTVTDALGMGKK
ncbi:hypothetical protein ASPWEDRAFT_118977 [Aspergillus wentii DTO 134E9]|uniref:DUF6987 domain-containing protein n=1 Tax=Aspergillus wentii DTO 134E9 TaxID=1073089 RepID=A0A1L9R9T0_ASPWE|nr:uncharacterized protein ASPWEDRAFT_118977 [Aspergillus wentii DTO 134E9]OJJ31685.1 hypothetical protein ASPWEDRAFT_118977 [Aspergillus wentii DTO 134E9]